MATLAVIERTLGGSVKARILLEGGKLPQAFVPGGIYLGVALDEATLMLALKSEHKDVKLVSDQQFLKAARERKSEG